MEKAVESRFERSPPSFRTQKFGVCRTREIVLYSFFLLRRVCAQNGTLWDPKKKGFPKVETEEIPIRASSRGYFLFSHYPIGNLSVEEICITLLLACASSIFILQSNPSEKAQKLNVILF